VAGMKKLYGLCLIPKAEAIPCNVIAAYYHDHIFVNFQDVQRAMKILDNLSK
jgi:hypothetical protein